MPSSLDPLVCEAVLGEGAHQALWVVSGVGVKTPVSQLGVMVEAPLCGSP